MVRFYCDRCNNEVEGPDDLIELVIETRERPSLAAWNARLDVCRGCHDLLREAINNLLGPSDDAKRKPVRRANS